MRNMQSTFDLTSFKNLNAPTYGGYAIYNFRFPKGNEIFGKTFYAIIDGTIYGLRILAWALGGCSTSPSLRYLVQLPTNFTTWMYLNNTPLYESINDLVNGENAFKIPVEWDYNVFDKVPSDLKMVNTGNSSSRCWKIKQSFYFYDDGKVHDTDTKIKYLVETPQGMFFGLEQRENCYKTKEECLSATFNGMDIVDFAEPTIIEIKIETPSTEVVTRKLVLE